MATQSFELASLNPDEMSSGRPTNFIATITKARYVPWHFPNSASGKYMLFAAWWLEPDEDSGVEPRVEYWRAGFLPSPEYPGAIPSNDGKEIEPADRAPAGGDIEFYQGLASGDNSIDPDDSERYEGIYALGDVRNNTDWAQVAGDMAKLGFDRFDPPSIANYEGYRVRMELMPQKFKGKNQEKSFDVLTVTEIVEEPKKKVSKGASASASTSAKPSASTQAAKSDSKKASSSSNGAGPIAETLSSIIVSAVAERGEEVDGVMTMPFSKLAGAIASSPDKGNFKVGDLLKASKDMSILEKGDGFTYNGDEKALASGKGTFTI